MSSIFQQLGSRGHLRLHQNPILEMDLKDCFVVQDHLVEVVFGIFAILQRLEKDKNVNKHFNCGFFNLLRRE